jgi:hypothetical protein
MRCHQAAAAARPRTPAFVVHGGEVLSRGPFGDSQAPPDLMVGPALGGESEDFAFTAGRFILTAEPGGRIECRP